MASRQNKVDVVYDYIDLAQTEIIKRWNDPTTKDILKHLIEKGIVEPKRLRTYTFMDLSIKYDISERQAQSIVYKERKKESASENITY